MPFILRFLLIILVLAGVGYAAMWWLATYPPEQEQIVKPVSNEALRN